MFFSLDFTRKTSSIPLIVKLHKTATLIFFSFPEKEIFFDNQSNKISDKDLIEMLQRLNPEAEIITEPTDGMNLREQYSFYDEGWEKEDLDKED